MGEILKSKPSKEELHCGSLSGDGINIQSADVICLPSIFKKKRYPFFVRQGHIW